MDGTTGSHHHTTTNSIKRVRNEASGGGDSPAKEERSDEVAFKRTHENDRLGRVICKLISESFFFI